MRRIFPCLLLLLLTSCSPQDDQALVIASPDGHIRVAISFDKQQALHYAVQRGDQTVLEKSPLGIALHDADFLRGLSLQSHSTVTPVQEGYELWTGKKSQVTYRANEQTLVLHNADGNPLHLVFRVSNDGLAFRYVFPQSSTGVKTFTDEITGFKFPATAKAWLQPVAVAQTGWKNTNPSYEESYEMEIPVGQSSPTEAGWVFPALFHSNDHWVLITEAGMDGKFHASRLQQHSGGGEYRIGFPMAAEVFTGGGLLAQSSLPFASPWRIITLGSLATIIESTLGTDLAAPMVTMETDFIKPGIASWSWGLLKDESVVFDVQKQFIDYSADMGWPYTLIDVNWDQNIGYERIRELVDYAAAKNVGILLWYNSSGDWNETDYSPKSKLLTREQRLQEFSRLQEMGVKGLKIDFFSGDGQSMMAYYTDILVDAAQHNLLINYHGSSLPRGLQRTYPHMMTMEAVKGFEMISFDQRVADAEAHHVNMLPYTRNAFDPMDFTPTVFFDIPNIERKTSNGFQLALPVIMLSGLQHIVETPEGMATVPYFVKNFMRKVPARWDEVKFLEGYPGKYTVLARKSGSAWYVAAINGEATDKNLVLDLSFVGNSRGFIIEDDQLSRSFVKSPLEATSRVEVNLPAAGGFVMVFDSAE